MGSHIHLWWAPASTLDLSVAFTCSCLFLPVCGSVTYGKLTSHRCGSQRSTSEKHWNDTCSTSVRLECQSSAGRLTFSPLRIKPYLFYLWLIGILRPSMQSLICKFRKLAHLFIFAGKGFVRGLLWPFRSAGATRPQQQPLSPGSLTDGRLSLTHTR